MIRLANQTTKSHNNVKCDWPKKGIVSVDKWWWGNYDIDDDNDGDEDDDDDNNNNNNNKVHVLAPLNDMIHLIME